MPDLYQAQNFSCMSNTVPWFFRMLKIELPI